MLILYCFLFQPDIRTEKKQRNNNAKAAKQLNMVRFHQGDETPQVNSNGDLPEPVEKVPSKVSGFLMKLVVKMLGG